MLIAGAIIVAGAIVILFFCYGDDPPVDPEE